MHLKASLDVVIMTQNVQFMTHVTVIKIVTIVETVAMT